MMGGEMHPNTLPPGYQQAPYQPRLGPSGLAITSMVLGILGLIPCVSIFFAPFALIFGIIALATAKKSQRPKGLAIAGTIMGGFSVVVFGGLMIYAVLDSRPKAFVAAAPTYETLIGEEFSGSGFHFDKDGKNYIGCSLHQFDGEAPDAMIASDLETNIPITGQVHEGTDVQVLTYDETVFTEAPTLVYESEPDVSTGDPVFLLVDGEAIKAHVTRYSILEGYWFEAETPFVGPGSSGSPVVSGLNGKVVGVLLGGDVSESMTEGYFEKLEMP